MTWLCSLLLTQVETIGDAYLIVGGVPEFWRDHADRVISMAFDMIDVCKTVISPADGNPIQVSNNNIVKYGQTMTSLANI